MKASKDVTKEEVVQFNLSELEKGAQKLKELYVSINLEEKRNELMKAFDERDRAQRSHQRVQSDISTIQKEILDMRVKLRERALKLAGTTQPSTLLH